MNQAAWSDFSFRASWPGDAAPRWSRIGSDGLSWLVYYAEHSSYLIRRGKPHGSQQVRFVFESLQALGYLQAIPRA